MPFPITTHGTVTVRASDVERVITIVEAAIRDAKPTELLRLGERITFWAGPLRLVHNWNQLVAIGSGELHFSQNGDEVRIHYRISFVQLLIVVTAMIALGFGVLPIASGADPRSLAGFLPLAWLWLFGGNYAITVFRFPRYLRRAVETDSASSRCAKLQSIEAPRN